MNTASLPDQHGPPRRIRVLIVDDHELIRVGLGKLVAAEPDMLLAGTAADGREAVEKAACTQPDVVIMDLSMPVMDGVSATREICGHSPCPRVLVLTSYSQQVMVKSALAAGACGYLLKDVSALELLDAIRRTHDGEALFSPSIG